MPRPPRSPNRIHLIAPANPLRLDLPLFGVETVDAYVALVKEYLPPDLRLTYDRRVLHAEEFPWNGGRQDDVARIRDLQRAIDDPQTLALVAANGGAYLTRLLPHLRLDALQKRAQPLWVMGFSEISTLVAWFGSQRAGRGLYWLCPNWLGHRIKPVDAARAAFAEFWRTLPTVLADRRPTDCQYLDFGPICGELVQGRVTSGRVRLVGGCLAVIANAIGGELGRSIRPAGKWIFLEDVKESPYRIDRHLAALKLAGWFERAAGVILGDFRMTHHDTQPATLDILRYHLPRDRKVPIVLSRSFGHTWPMVPIAVNRPVPLTVRRREVTIVASGLRD